MSVPKVVFVVNETAHYYEYKKILLNSNISRRINGYILFECQGYELEELFAGQIQDCKENNFKYTVLSDPFLQSHPRIIKILISNRARFIPGRHFLILFIKFLLSISNQTQYFRRRIKKLKIFFQEHDFDQVILGEENVLLDTFVYSKAALSGKIFVYPYTIPNPQEMKVGSYESYPLDSFLARFLKLIFPQWVKVFSDRIFLLLPPQKILALYLIGFFPKNPWILNADTEGQILIESDKMKKLYLSFKVDPKKLNPIGSFNDDLLFEKIKIRSEQVLHFSKKYRLDSQKPTLLVAFPPNQFPKKNSEIENYPAVIQFYAESLKPYLEWFNVVISRHPRTLDPLTLLKQEGIIVADESTIDLVAISSAFIATVSATIRWALLVKVPVINFDFYNYKYTDYSDEPDVITVYTKQEFLTALGRLKSQIHDTSLESSKNSTWGFLDGKVHQRFIDIMSSK